MAPSRQCEPFHSTVRAGPTEVGTLPYRIAAIQVICSLHYTAIERKVGYSLCCLRSTGTLSISESSPAKYTVRQGAHHHDYPYRDIRRTRTNSSRPTCINAFW
ncbi:MAG: hypothetical protein QOC89_4898 [Paraburkholderia sp.]|nr:hypothetical protein [Paraburkholderia sp.]